MKEALEKQVGGDHYKSLAVQPMEFAIANTLPWAEGEIVKYVTRWRAKGGIEDLEKAEHILQALLEHVRAEQQAKAREKVSRWSGA